LARESKKYRDIIAGKTKAMSKKDDFSMLFVAKSPSGLKMATASGMPKR
jgi:hypothetical protein